MAPGPDMLVDCPRCGGAHRFCDPCPPVGECSRMLQKWPIGSALPDVAPPDRDAVRDEQGRWMRPSGRTPGVARWEGGS